MPNNFTTCVQFPISKEKLRTGEELIIDGTEKLKKGATINTNGSYLIHSYPKDYDISWSFAQKDGFITAVLDVPAGTKSLSTYEIIKEFANILEPGKIQVESFDPRTGVLHGKYIV